MAEKDVTINAKLLFDSILQKFQRYETDSSDEAQKEERSQFLLDQLLYVESEVLNGLLVQLVRRGSGKIIRCIADAGITIRLPIEKRIRTALHEAERAEVAAPIDALSQIYSHVNYEADNDEGHSITHLQVAVKEKCATAVSKLLENATIESALIEFQAYFTELISRDGRDTLEALLLKGIDSDECVDEDGMTPLSRLCRRVSSHRYFATDPNEPIVEVIQLLVRYGADVNSQDSEGQTPLMKLFRSGVVEPDKQLEIARLLLDNGANVNQRDHMNDTVLHAALGVYHLSEYHGPSHDPRRENEACIRVAKLLLERGAEVDAHNDDGITPLYNAVGYCNYDAVKLLLLEHGAALDAVNYTSCYMESSNGYLRNLEMTQNAIDIIGLLEGRGYQIGALSTLALLNFLVGFVPEARYYEARYVLAYVQEPEKICKFFDYIAKVTESDADSMNSTLDDFELNFSEDSEKIKHAMIAGIEIQNYLNFHRISHLRASRKMIKVLRKIGRELRRDYSLRDVDTTKDSIFYPLVMKEQNIIEEVARAKSVKINKTTTLFEVCKCDTETAYELLRNSNYASVVNDRDKFEADYPNIGIYIKGNITQALVKGFLNERIQIMATQKPAAI